ncbi:hypothetical protein ABVK25_006656 [Lepraria finkii]|uniref:Amidase domain-containing protein n=1 Tax=Lepraria finkii TaxID=1340010 RepID=A0ABR4B593_9LECA
MSSQPQNGGPPRRPRHSRRIIASFHLPAIAGLPVVTVPLGFFPTDTAVEMNLKGTIVTVAHSIPFGLALIGRRWSRESRLGLANAFEKQTMARQKITPYISPTFELENEISSGPERESPAQQPAQIDIVGDHVTHAQT